MESNTNGNNQDPKADKGKLRLTLVPLQIIREIAKVRMFGVAKYPKTGVEGWKSIEIQRIRDAAFRHFIAYLEDPAGLDEESGLPHLSHLACNISFLCEMELSYPAQIVIADISDEETKKQVYDMWKKWGEHDG